MVDRCSHLPATPALCRTHARNSWDQVLKSMSDADKDALLHEKSLDFSKVGVERKKELDKLFTWTAKKIWDVSGFAEQRSGDSASVGVAQSTAGGLHWVNRVKPHVEFRDAEGAHVFFIFSA